jgi:hypothetical protein
MAHIKGPLGAEAAAQEAARRAAEEAAKQAAEAAAKRAAAAAKPEARAQAAQDRMSRMVGQHSGSHQLVDLSGAPPAQAFHGGVSPRALEAMLHNAPALASLTTGGAGSLGVQTLLAKQSGTDGSPAVASALSTGTVEGTAPLSPEEQAREDAKLVEEAVRIGGPEAGAEKMAELVQQHPNDPAYADALIATCSEGDPSIMHQIAHMLGNRVEGDLDDGAGGLAVTGDTLENLAILYGAAGEAGRQQLTGTLAEALPDGDLNQFDDTLVSLALDGKDHGLLEAMRAQLAATRPEAAAALAVEETNQVRERYDALAEEKAALDAQLEAELAALGPSMTPEEIERYRQGFYASHDVYAKYAAAADELSTTLAANRATLEARAAAGDEDAARALVDGYESLATTPNHADEAIQWVSDVSQTPAEQNPLFQALDKATDGDLAKDVFGEKILAAAVPNAQAEILAQHVGSDDPNALQQAWGAFNTLMSGLTTAEALGSLATEVKDFLTATEEGMKGNLQAVADSQFSDWGGKSAFGKSLAIASFTQSVVATGTSLAGGNVPEAIKNALEATEGGLEIAAGVIDTLGRAGRIAPDAGKFAAKALPYVGAVVDAIQLSEDLKKALEDPTNAGHWVAAAGTIISLVGDAAGMIPVLGFLPDVLLGAVGEVVHMIGESLAAAISGNREEKERNEEQARLLAQATGMPFETALEIVEAGPADLARMRALGLSPQQIRELAADPNVELNSIETAVILKAAAMFGLKGEDVMALVRAGQDEDVMNLLVPFLGRIDAGDDVAQTRELALMMLRESGHGEVADILARGSGPIDPKAWGSPYEILEGDGVQVDP